MILVLTTSLIACDNDTTPDTVPDTETTDTETMETADTYVVDRPDPRSDVFSSLIIGELLPSAATDLQYYDPSGFYGFAVSTVTDGGYANLSFCLLIGGACVTEYPAAGATVNDSLDLDFLYYDLELLDPGEITAAGVSMPFYSGNGFNVGFPTALEGPGDLSVEGNELVPYEGTDVFPVVSEGLGTVTPDPANPITLLSDGDVTFTWTPGTTGNVLLTVGDAIIGLDDSAGTYTLDAADLGLDTPAALLTGYLSRQTYTEVDAAGNTFKVETRIDQSFLIDYRDAAAVEMVEGTTIADTCKASKALTPVGAGSYFGTTATFTDTIDLGDYNPLTYYTTAGRDGFVRIDLAKGETLSVVYTQLIDDAATYLLGADCDENAPLAGSDVTLGGGPEAFEYTAAAAGPVYLALDAWYAGMGTQFALTVDIAAP